jgi:acyl-CoA-dependent ceramide synthase
MLKYTGCQQACDAAFALFVVLWFGARHIGYLSICWSIYAHVATVTMPYGTYSTLDSTRLSTDGGHGVIDNLLQPLLNPGAKTVAFNSEIRNMFLGLLGGLQLITIAWFVMILRVVAKVLQGQPADDSRSDDEGEEEEEEVENDDESPVSLPSHEAGIPYKLRAEPQATAGAERKFIEVTASSEDLRFTASHPSNSSKASSKRKGKGGISSGLHLGEHKDILNRIGCLSDEQMARERELRQQKEDGRRK